MTDESRGMAVRREVLGDEYVDRALARRDDFTEPFQDFITPLRLGRGVGPAGPRPPHPVVHHGGAAGRPAGL